VCRYDELLAMIEGSSDDLGGQLSSVEGDVRQTDYIQARSGVDYSSPDGDPPTLEV